MQKELKHLKYRPPYNHPVRGHAKAYWKYAIKSTIYYLRKAKNSAQIKTKRQSQTIELSALYKIRDFNTWIKENYAEKVYSEHMIMDLVSGDKTLKFADQTQIEKHIYSLECKLTAEQMVVAFTKA